MIDIIIAITMWCGDPGAPYSRTRVDQCRARLIKCVEPNGWLVSGLLACIKKEHK